MYYQSYEDYMRSVLGYPLEQNTYETYQQYDAPFETSQVYSNSARYSDEVMDLYPEIYKIVNPMICKICDANTKPITRELVNQMTEEIYMNLETEPEVDTVVNVRVNTSNETEKIEKNSRISSHSQTLSQNRSTKSKDNEKPETQQIEKREDRQRRPNNNLRDLIRILILNRLLGGGFFPGRPPRPHPPRPPRPPMRPPYPREDRYYNEYFRL